MINSLLGILAIPLIFFYPYNANANANANECEISYARQVIDAILNDQFRLAEKIIMEWGKTAADSISTDFYHANTLFAKASNQRKKVKTKLLAEALNVFQSVRDRLLNQQIHSEEDLL